MTQIPTLRRGRFNGDWRAEDAAPMEGYLVDALRWGSGVVPVVNLAQLDVLLHEQAAIIADPVSGAEQDVLALEGLVLVHSRPAYEDDEPERHEPVEIDGEPHWILNLGWTFYEVDL